MVRHISLKPMLVGLLLAGMMVSCTDEDLPNNNFGQDAGTSLQIAPAVFGLTVGQTRATEDLETAKSGVKYNESTINTMDVYILKEGTVLIAKRFTATENAPIKNDGTERYLLAEDWKKAGIENNTNYPVYVSVNSKLGAGAVEAMKGKTEAYLKALNTQDANIYKRYGTPEQFNALAAGYGDNPIDTEKSFLMDYYTTWNSGTEASKVIQMSAQQGLGLKRAAAKIILNVTFSEEFKNVLENTDGSSEYTYTIDGTPLVRYVNFGFNTTDFANGTYDETIGQDISTGSLFKLTDVDPDGKTGGYTNAYNKYGLTTYSFHTEWTAENKADAAPHMMISIGYKRNDRPTADYNYYLIPVCGDITSLDRNNLYIVNAEITSFGSTTDSDDMESVNLTYQVVEWKEYTPAEIEALEFRYLKVNPTTQYLYGNGEQKVDLNYYVNSGDKVIFDQLVVTYKDASNDTITVTGQNIDDYITDKGDGTFTVKSTSLANHAVKDFTFCVRLADSNGNAYTGTNARSVTVTMRHFPTDNIQNIEGAWSSREDYSIVTYSYSNFSTLQGNRNSQKTGYWQHYHTNLLGQRVWETGNSNYNVINDQNNSPGQNWGWREDKIYFNTTSSTTNYDWVDWDEDNGKHVDKITESDIFNAKYWDGSRCRRIIYDDGWYGDGITFDDSSNSNLKNNHMYVVQIGSASADYVIGNPKLDDNFQSEDDVVAPTFMIASQLGAVSPSSDPLGAASHCGHYIEVTHDAVNGLNMRKVYKNWRLPTQSEVGVIIKYQKEDLSSTGMASAMFEVLGGDYYWALNGHTAFVPTGTGQGSQDTMGYVRCVRTMTADDLKYLNGLMTDQEKMNYLEAY